LIDQEAEDSAETETAEAVEDSAEAEALEAEEAGASEEREDLLRCMMLSVTNAKRNAKCLSSHQRASLFYVLNVSQMQAAQEEI
jgi:hypothetical protein